MQVALGIGPFTTWLRAWTPHPLGDPSFIWMIQLFPGEPSTPILLPAREAPSLTGAVQLGSWPPPGAATTIRRCPDYYLEYIVTIDSDALRQATLRPDQWQPRRIRAWRPGSPSAIWRDGRLAVWGFRAVDGPEEDAEWQQARRAKNLVLRLGNAPRGWAMSNEDALDEAVQLGRVWLANNPRAEPGDFGREELADMKCIGLDGLHKWMRRKHFTMKLVHPRLT